MARSPILSICVPSRNRQFYFKQTIEALLASPRMDVEFVLADNSDNPAEMNDYMQAHRFDPRVVYLPSEDRTLSMLDNWERTIRRATGDFVTFIGDDDYLDPDLVEVLLAVRRKEPDVEAVGWAAASYFWPEGQPVNSSVFLCTHTEIMQIRKEFAFTLMFQWRNSGSTPKSGFSIYHSAISRRLLDRIQAMFPGNYFQHPTLDYEMAMKVIVAGTKLVYCARPMSVMGICKLSNSSAVGDVEIYKERLAALKQDLGRELTEDTDDDDFPFPTALGLTACVGQAMHWFKRKWNLNVTGWEENFIKACVANVEQHRPEHFEVVREAYLEGVKRFRGGKYLDLYHPVSPETRKGIFATGFNADGVYISPLIGGSKTPAEMWAIASAMLKPIAQIAADLTEVPDHNTILRRREAEMAASSGAEPKRATA